MIQIGEFSKLAKTTIKALRFYDEIGIFKPCLIGENGYRYYDISQLNDLQKILALREIDMPLDEIKKVLSGGDVLEVFEKTLNELQERLLKNQTSISLIKKYMANAEKGEFMENYEAKMITLPKVIVYYRHGVIDSMENLASFVLETGELAAKSNPNLKCKNYCFVTYEAKEYKEKDVELEYLEEVEKAGVETDEIKFKTLDETKAVSCFHKGSYENLGKAYAFAVNYVKEKGYEINGAIRECYIDGCWNKDSEEDYLTEIQIPVK